MMISLHAPHGGSDSVFISCPPSGYISIHAPRGGSDPKPPPQPLPPQPFQSTLPVGGATRLGFRHHRHQPDFNPRSPWGERHRHGRPVCRENEFQSTLPAGGATVAENVRLVLGQFQSTLPAGGATGHIDGKAIIHLNFNPRSPRGERLRALTAPGAVPDISIHAPRGGSDRWMILPKNWPSYFNPRSPRGERRDSVFQNITSFLFQSTLPAGGATVQRIWCIR